MNTELVIESENQKVYEWRFKLAQSNGYDSGTADEIACNQSIDIHQLEALIKRGCERQTALAIVS